MMHLIQTELSYKLRLSSAVGFRSVRKSRVTSKLSQLEAMLGATLSRLGTMPLYSPLTPSWRTMTRTASDMDLYWYPMPDMVLIWKRLRSTSLCIDGKHENQSQSKGHHLQWIGTRLSNCAGNGTRQQFAYSTRVLLAFRRECLAN